MKYFKDDNNCVYAYASDGSQDKFIKPNLILITEKEAMDIVNPPKTNGELLQTELQTISKKYQEDIDALNQAYLAAVVSDGPGEPAKQQAVRDAITARKAQYAADKEAARLKYPV
ncbi:hypothetical protein F8538_06440 [Edwardsiella ictaluri]|uniref:hypothetical protein n=1 Tax=Edwardsiella ictaluri TaxID=67780 RepID=UPI0018DB48BC|nr:hypothetical protein [Edwardsiella ictaluri]QPW26508.1 hypothetical protein F8538_06440 [Edwardsiella ictaluri]